MGEYIELTKPRITWLILMSTGVGYFFGARSGWHWVTLLHTMFGTGLIASGTAALNQWYERDADSKMRRTMARPLPSGRISTGRALWFASVLSALGFLELAVAVNLLSALLGLFTLVSYLFVYTPLKQRSPHSTTIGAIPGAMPPLIGYAAASDNLSWEAWVLFAILFLWQFPHFYAIAWMYREDYERAGIRMLPVVEPDGQSTAHHILLYMLLLLPISLLHLMHLRRHAWARSGTVGEDEVGDPDLAFECMAVEGAAVLIGQFKCWDDAIGLQFGGVALAG